MLFVFMSQPDFGCNPYALWEYIKNETDYETAWIIKRPEYLETLRNRNIKCELYNTIKGQELVNSADYVIMNSYTFLALKKVKKQIWINLWHGSGIKAHDFYCHNMNPKQVKKLHNYFNQVDLMCVHSLDDRFKLAAQLNFDMRKIYVTGQARLDYINNSFGKELLAKIFGKNIVNAKKIIFFAPSFRANGSTHSGTIFSENIFRLSDYDNNKLNQILSDNDTFLVYKLHPIEQTAFSGRKFDINERCLELTDKMLFESNIRYYELLNAFDIMISDYSSIAFDFLMLNRPIIYLIPDYDEYTSERGFVFKNVEDYMPGEKVFNFNDMLNAIEDALSNPDKYKNEREFVLRQRFDYQDSNSAKRCLDTILNYKPIDDSFEIYHCPVDRMPTIAEHLSPYIKNRQVIDSQSIYSETEKRYLLSKKDLLYITGEQPTEFRRLSGQSYDEIADFEFYNELVVKRNIDVLFCQGGVDCEKFKSKNRLKNNTKTRIGFAGTIDNKIYFAMVQCICEVFSDCEIVFAGHIYGDYPIWMDGFENLKYIPSTYDDLPEIIESFDVAILPFFGRHQEKTPCELFQYMAMGKQVIASNMPKIPNLNGIYKSKSISEFIDNIKLALNNKANQSIIDNLIEESQKYSWKNMVL